MKSSAKDNSSSIEWKTNLETRTKHYLLYSTESTRKEKLSTNENRTYTNKQSRKIQKNIIDGKTLLDVTFTLVNNSTKKIKNCNIGYYYKIIFSSQRIYHRQWS